MSVDLLCKPWLGSVFTLFCDIVVALQGWAFFFAVIYYRVDSG